jgi:hypothetical protein
MISYDCRSGSRLGLVVGMKHDENETKKCHEG